RVLGRAVGLGRLAGAGCGFDANGVGLGAAVPVRGGALETQNATPSCPSYCVPTRFSDCENVFASPKVPVPRRGVNRTARRSRIRVMQREGPGACWARRVSG